jgi:4a-hydroxytetrahydrobiopterin dehydratase
MWIEEDNQLKKSFKFSNFQEGLDFINSINDIIESINHHPTITLNWGRVDISTTTHDEGNKLTDLDYQLTKLIDSINDK